MGLFFAKQYVSFYPLDTSTKIVSSSSTIDEVYVKNAAIQAISDPATTFTAIPDMNNPNQIHTPSHEASE
jgi:hypothetical protein